VGKRQGAVVCFEVMFTGIELINRYNIFWGMNQLISRGSFGRPKLGKRQNKVFNKVFF